MASHLVRTTVKAWLNAGTVPFYDSVNVEINPADDIWVTVDWVYGSREALSYCGEMLESGTFNVVFFGRPGIGEDVLLTAAEAEMAVLMTRIDTSGRVVLLSHDAPSDFRQEEHYCIEFMVNYEFS